MCNDLSIHFPRLGAAQTGISKSILLPRKSAVTPTDDGLANLFTYVGVGCINNIRRFSALRVTHDEGNGKHCQQRDQSEVEDHTSIRKHGASFPGMEYTVSV